MNIIVIVGIVFFFAAFSLILGILKLIEYIAKKNEVKKFIMYITHEN